MLLLPSELWARATTAWKKLPFDLVASTIVSGLNQSFGSQYFNISSSQCKIAVRALQSTRLGGGLGQHLGGCNLYAVDSLLRSQGYRGDDLEGPLWNGAQFFQVHSGKKLMNEGDNAPICGPSNCHCNSAASKSLLVSPSQVHWGQSYFDPSVMNLLPCLQCTSCSMKNIL